MDFDHVLVAGGGSGGHVFPALAVADELRDRGWQVSWLGRTEGMERRLVEDRGLPYYGVAATAVVGRSMPARAGALIRVMASSIRARGIVRRRRVGAVLGTGGYVSAPGVLGAYLARRPAVLIEPNASPGAANRWLSRFATVAAIGSHSAGQGIQCPTQETGVPIRSAFLGERPAFNLGGPVRLLVLGGSQGARQLNEILPAALARLAATETELEVVHQVGAELLGEAEAAYEQVALSGIEVSVVPFLDDIHGAMAASHLIVSRAGAITLAEICAVGRAALLLPLGLAGSHQVANARALVDVGGAVVLGPGPVTAERLIEELSRLLADRQRLRTMGDALYTLARPWAAAAIADLVQATVRSC